MLIIALLYVPAIMTQIIVHSITSMQRRMTGVWHHIYLILLLDRSRDIAGVGG